MSKSGEKSHYVAYAPMLYVNKLLAPPDLLTIVGDIFPEKDPTSFGSSANRFQ